ncbi:MAG: thiosulfate oxidation carrier protein SoxY [Gammaproteobacteria bacterium]|nr:thiosulfate oxidation carrier protein SoxY [Gammaproteobacteria bacterium]MDH5802045.1 thiosulfate oxidation carrier protein SoxY [Gammaproteobacteria bacterium]
MNTITRRKFIASTAGCSLAGLFLPGNYAWAQWPTQAFGGKDITSVIEKLYGSSKMEDSAAITIKAPDIAENGAVVPVSIKTKLTGVESVSILVDENPNPLAAQFLISPGNSGDVATRIKLAKKSKVTAVVKANGKLYTNSRFIKVTLGGCGGPG